MLKRFLLSFVLLLAPVGARPAPEVPFDRGAFQVLLQRFVNERAGRSFRRLGDERDFDHVHLLAASAGGRPRALLYHTQELADGSLDPGGRNWLQWTDSGVVENAAAYQRRAYPRTPSWNLFRARELPIYLERGTIVQEMLEPARLGFAPAESRQWTFAGTGCASPDFLLAIRLPAGGRACLTLEAF